MTQNVLRKNQSKLPMVIFFIILFLLEFLGVTYITYCYNLYCIENGITNNFSTETLIGAFEYVGKSIEFSGDLLINAIKLQITELWYVHLVVIGLIYVMFTSSKQNPYQGMAHGSARFATQAEIKRFQKDTTGIPCGKDFYVPIDGKVNGIKVISNLNEVVVAGSGAGKSFRKVQPDIMQMWGSYIVTDPKGELYRNCYKLLKENGYKIKVLNLININLSDSYNPFAYMSSEQDVLEVCSLFMSASAGEDEKEDFWVGTALELLTAVSIYLFKTADEIKCFGRVIRLINSIQYDSNGKIDPNCELSRCMNKHATIHPYDVASITWSGMQETPHETMASIQKTLSTRLRLWAVEDVDLLTAEDEMDFDSVGVEKTAIFLILPVPSNSYKAVANIFYSQLFQRLFRVADEKYNGKLKQLVSFELDEFANIGKIPNFEKILAVVRSYNIRVCVVLQDLSQLKALYKDTYEGIIANCSITTFLGTTEQSTLEALSKKLGNISVQTDSRSYNRAGQGGGSDTESTATRALLNPDEITEAVKPKGESIKYDGSCIIWVGYERPFYLLKYDTLSHPLMEKVGGPSDTPYQHNNTNINDIYGGIYAEKKERHRLLLEEKRKELAIENQELAEAQQAEYEAKQAELKERFNAEFENQIQLPLSDKQEEERVDAEFEEECEDTSLYEDGISDEEFDIQENVNPALERILSQVDMPN
ncbi:MAG: type IV secretory system conjugative DNA transfer family protein [Acutalibacteraceae bacterium]|nr:type IV secretory system conjugative DNA transfer family protein [Acutalibacteraceae bacterium]